MRQQRFATQNVFMKWQKTLLDWVVQLEYLKTSSQISNLNKSMQTRLLLKGVMYKREIVHDSTSQVGEIYCTNIFLVDLS